MADKFFYAFGANNFPNPYSCVVATSQEPLAFNRTVLFEDYVGLNA
jgi:hypothetical protein